MSATMATRPLSMLGALARQSRCIKSVSCVPRIHPQSKHQFHTSVSTRAVYEAERFVLTDEEVEEILAERRARGWRRYLDNYHLLVQETKLWTKEVKEFFVTFFDKRVILDGDEQMIWNFADEEQRSQWNYSCDSIKKQGFSTCSLSKSDSGYMVFEGNLDVDRLPKDGNIIRAGWAGCYSPFLRKSFFRVKFDDWQDFTHIKFRVRGDGRTYGIIIRTPGVFSHNFQLQFIYALHTRGGPYWQTVEIPFSKFILSNRGEVADIIPRINLARVNSLGISMMDNRTGPFKLEIKDVSLRFDSNYTEESAYEHYYHPKHGWAS